MGNVSLTVTGFVNIYPFGLGKRIHKTRAAADAAAARSATDRLGVAEVTGAGEFDR